MNGNGPLVFGGTTMKRALSLALALALTLAVVPAMAGDDETFGSQTPGMFQALSSLSSAEQAALTPLSDDQLAAIEGGNPCAGSINVGGNCEVSISFSATIGQSSMCSSTTGANSCGNTAGITQVVQ
jgi:hypothetical protein